MVAEHDSTPLKTCTRCKRQLPESLEFFSARKTGYRNGLYSRCRVCELQDKRDREGWTKERKRSPKAREGYVYCTRCDQEFPATLEYFYADPRYKSGFKPTCRPCAIIYSRESNKKHPERVARNHREWRKNNPDKVKRHKSDSQKRNRNSANVRSKRWRERHPDKLREYTRIGAHRRRHAPGKFMQADIDLQLKSQTDKKGRLRCWWCGNAITEYEIDHRLAIRRGGTHDPSNLCLSCPTCNRSKSARTAAEWNGRLL